MSAEAEELCNQGLELMTQHRWAEAEKKMMIALHYDDKSPELLYNFGKCLFHQDKYSEAILALSRAITARSSVPYEGGIEFPVRGIKYPEAAALLGSCYYAVRNAHDAWAMFLGAISPDNSKDFNRECRTAAAHSLLAQGTYNDWGWGSYQERLAEPDTWDGYDSLVGKTLLVKAEGGLGDQIFFARYGRMLSELGAGYVIWEADEPLASYIKAVCGGVAVRGREVPECDYMVHAGSLPYIFGTKTGTIPVFESMSSYVENPKRIGIACSGNPLHPDDHHRSIPLAEFEPLLDLGKKLFLMQKDLRHTDRPHFRNIEETPARDVLAMSQWIRSMDLVITVDTMTAHLAGAEGIPTWLLLPYACDWRWKLEGDRTPWYPCMRIFRQGADREWGPVIQRVVEELKNA